MRLGELGLLTGDKDGAHVCLSGNLTVLEVRPFTDGWKTQYRNLKCFDTQRPTLTLTPPSVDPHPPFAALRAHSAMVNPNEEEEKQDKGFHVSGISSADMDKFGGEEGFKAALFKKVQEVLPPGLSLASITRDPVQLPPNMNRHIERQCKILANAVYKIPLLEGMGAQIIQCGQNALGNLINEATELVASIGHAQRHPLNLPCLVSDGGLDPNPDKLTPVHTVATSGAPQTLKTVLASGQVDLNVRNARGETPLRMLVARHGSKPNAAECAKLLIERMNEPGQVPDLTLPVPLSELNEVRRQGVSRGARR